MNEIDLHSSIAGAAVSTLLWLVVYLFKKSQKSDQKTLESIPSLIIELTTLKAELGIVHSSYAIVTSAAEKIILLKSALDAAFRKIDELRESIDTLQGLREALQLVELSNEDNARIIAARLHLLKRAVEQMGGTVDHVAWIDPERNDEQKKENDT